MKRYESEPELTALRREFEHVRAERVQLETLVASLRDELTAVTLERDGLKRKCAALALLLYGNPLPHGNGV